MENSGKNKIVWLSIEQLHAHPDNPRKDLGDLTELAESIKANGILQNLTVVPWASQEGYTVIIGHRRHAAAQLAGLTELPCVVTYMTAEEQHTTMLCENVQRRDLTAYEQAQAFHQLAFDFNQSVQSISQRTGFSESTVRRRLKMAELDQSKLEEVSARQLSFEDLDELSRIEDIEKRNEVLEHIGTNNFDVNVKKALQEQEYKKRLPSLKKRIKELGLEEMKRSDMYSGEFDFLETVDVCTYEESTELSAEAAFYVLEEWLRELKLYKKAPKIKKAKEDKKTKAQMEREKFIKSRQTELDKLAETFYELRRDYICDITMTKNNTEILARGAAWAAAFTASRYSTVNSNEIDKILGISDEDKLSYDARFEERLLRSQNRKLIPAVIYLLFGDRKDEKSHTYYSADFPAHKVNERLELIYKWLGLLGYAPSDEETAYLNGTHKLFIDDMEESEK
ncbi:MAG: ParB/RepB/Spo0J family partition protein [Clostridia bacterium]|nr:ParB/RepB/Spo0J family partition protein [Clostridia bacterium]